MATSRLSTRRVEWRILVGSSRKPARGLVVFEASVSYIPDPLASSGPRTVVPEPVLAIIDTSGYICTPDPNDLTKAGERGVVLDTTDSLSEDGGDWTWVARPQLRSVNGVQMIDAIPPFGFVLPAAADSLDLADVQKVPASPGLGTEQAVALVTMAKAAADSVVARANAGEFKGERGWPGVNAVPTSEAVAEYVKTPGNPVNGALRSTLASKLDLVSKLVTPIHVSHRGGPLRYPEHSMEGYRASAQSGFLPEQDINMLADGTLVCIHDDTTGRTMTGPNVPVRSLTREEWLARRIKPAITGGDFAMPVLWDDVLNEFGGRAVLVPEIKGSDMVVAQKVIDSIVERGLERCVIVQSFDRTANYMSAAAGIASLALGGGISRTTATALVAAGITFTGPSMELDATQMKMLNDAGMTVIPYTSYTYETTQAMLDMGAAGVFMDDPWGNSGRFLSKRIQNYSDGSRWVGSQGATSNDALAPMPDGKLAFVMNGSGATRVVEQGWAGELPARGLTIDFDLWRKRASTTHDSARIYLSRTLHGAARETAGDWLLVLVRASGQLAVFRRTAPDGASVLAGSVDGFLPNIANSISGDVHRLRIGIDALGAIHILKQDGTGLSIGPEDARPTVGNWWLSFGNLSMTVGYANVSIDPEASVDPPKPPPSDTDPYAKRALWYGSSGFDGAKDSFVTMGNGKTGLKTIEPTGPRSIEQGWAGAIPSRSSSVEFDLIRANWAENNASARIYLSTTLNTKSSESQDSWLLVAIRGKGELVVFSRSGGGTITNLGSMNLFLPADAAIHRIKIALDADGALKVTNSSNSNVFSATAAQVGLLGTPLWMSTATLTMDATYGGFKITR